MTHSKIKKLHLFLCALVLFVLTGTTSAWAAKTVVLFDKNWQFHPSYNHIMDDLTKNHSKNKIRYPYAIDIGDTLVVGDRQFIFQGFLGNGSTSVVLAVSDHEALRLPQQDAIYDYYPTKNDPLPYSVFIDYTIDGYEALKKTQIPILAKIAERASRYVLVEREFVYFTLDDLKRGSPKLKDWKPELIQRATEEFVDAFAPKTAEFTNIGDFNSTQVAYTKRGWVLLDFTRTVKFAKKVSDRTLLEDLFISKVGTSPAFKAAHVPERALEKIYEQRKALGLPTSFASRCGVFFGRLFGKRN